MTETRFGKQGRTKADLFIEVFEKHTADLGKFALEFLEEFDTYSFVPKKKGEPANGGCVRELEGIDVIDLGNPVHLAKLAKEMLHTQYQKQNSSRDYEAFRARIITRCLPDFEN